MRRVSSRARASLKRRMSKRQGEDAFATPVQTKGQAQDGIVAVRNESDSINEQKRREEESREVSLNLFSTRRPRDALAGLSSGLKNVAKGVATGVAALVAAPVTGAREDGVRGFAKGVALGAFGAVGLVAAGAATGVYQVGRGIMNTPEAIIAAADGEKMWDPDERKWILYSLSAEATRRLGEDAKRRAEEAGRPSSDRVVVDTTLYDVLEVSSNASPAEIRKAYHRMAIKLHPDRNPADSGASEKFQKVGNAYQVLIDDQLRSVYDKGGLDGFDERRLVDSEQFYHFVFGTDRFRGYIGDLRIMGMQGAMNSDDPQEMERQIKETKALDQESQLTRRVQLAVNLVDLVTPYMQGNETEDEVASFRKLIEAEAKELAADTLGSTMLGVVGYVYVEQSSRYLDKTGVYGVKQMSHELKNGGRLVYSAARIAEVASREYERKDTEPADSQRMPDEKDVMKMMDFLLNIAIFDVESTLRYTCTKVFWDADVSKGDRKKRARAVKLVGKVFQEHGKSLEDGCNHLKGKVGFPSSPQQQGKDADAV